MNSYSIKKRFTLRLLCLACSSILSCSFEACISRPSAECRAFYDLNYEQRRARVRSAPLEEQIDLYKCGMYQEPPTDYADEIANDGEKIIPYLLERIRTEPSETFKDLLLRIFEELARRGYLRGRRDVVEQLRATISAINNDEIKKSAQEKLGFIERNL